MDGHLNTYILNNNNNNNKQHLKHIKGDIILNLLILGTENV